jgi:cytochrome c5
MARSGLAQVGRAALAASGLFVALTHFAAAEDATLKSLKLEFPADTAQFVGAGADAVNSVCLACHSAEMVLMQPKLSPAAWKAEVNKMRAVFKAPVADADVDAIVDYLVKLQNPG